MAPPLSALGGWRNAEWFAPALVADTSVVGFSLPRLPGLRRQNFNVTDRSVADKVPRGRTTASPEIVPRRIAGKLAVILDTHGATRAVACCRSRFLFETGPVLFFAEIPLGKLKARAAARLRRALIDIGVQGCVVWMEAATATLMVWLAAETDIAQFIHAAIPDYPLHSDFFKSGMPAQGVPKADRRAADRQAALLAEVAALRTQIGQLQQARSARGAMEQLGLDDARLKSMLRLLHPDKHGGSEAANEAAKWLNNLRDMLKSSG